MLHLYFIRSQVCLTDSIPIHKNAKYTDLLINDRYVDML